MILQCALCHHTGLDVESRIVADESPLGYHREPRCVDIEKCAQWAAEWAALERMERISASRRVEG